MYIKLRSMNNYLYIVLPELFHFHGTDCSKDFITMLLVEEIRWIPFMELVVKHGI